MKSREGRRVERKDIDELDEITNPYPENTKTKFLFENTKVFLTYGSRLTPVHLDKESFIKTAETLFKTPIEFIRLAHESGSHDNKDEPYYHTHVLIKWEQAVRTKSCRHFDIIHETEDEEICLHPNIRRIKTQTHFDRCCRYIAKEDPDNKDLLKVFTTWQESLKECKTRADVIDIAQKPSDINGLLTAFDIRSTLIPKTEINYELCLSRWQRQLYTRLGITSFGIPSMATFRNNDTIEGDSDEEFDIVGDARIGRNVIVIYNPEGGCGKTRYAKTLLDRERWRFCTLQGISKARDFTSQIQSALDAGWTGDTILMNITRQCADHKIYNSIEIAIDGLLTTEKYIGKTTSWLCRNVVLFTNFMPKLTALTLDRWEIYHVRKLNGNLHRISLDICMDIYKEETAKRREIENDN